MYISKRFDTVDKVNRTKKPIQRGDCSSCVQPEKTMLYSCVCNLSFKQWKSSHSKEQSIILLVYWANSQLQKMSLSLLLWFLNSLDLLIVVHRFVR